MARQEKYRKKTPTIGEEVLFGTDKHGSSKNFSLQSIADAIQVFFGDEPSTNIGNKADRPTSYSEDNIQLSDADGNIKDSGKSIETSLTDDNSKVPTSGGVKAALAVLEANIEENTSAISDLEDTKAEKTDVESNTSLISSLDADKADKSNVLEKDNSEIYSPTDNYHPATKKFVEDTASNLISGRVGVWDLTPPTTYPQPPEAGYYEVKSDATVDAGDLIGISVLAGGHLYYNFDSDTWEYSSNSENAVKTTAVSQDIDGDKNIIGTLSVPTPTDDAHAENKGRVDVIRKKQTIYDRIIPQRVLNPHFLGMGANGRGADGWLSNPTSDVYEVVDGICEFKTVGATATMAVRIADDYPLDAEEFIHIVDVYVPNEGDNVNVYSIVFYDGGYFFNSSKATVNKQGWNRVVLKGIFGDNRPNQNSLTAWDIRHETVAEGVKIKNARLLVGADVQVYYALEDLLNESMEVAVKTTAVSQDIDGDKNIIGTLSVPTPTDDAHAENKGRVDVIRNQTQHLESDGTGYAQYINREDGSETVENSIQTSEAKQTIYDRTLPQRIVNPRFIGMGSDGRGADGWISNPTTDTYEVVDGVCEFKTLASTASISSRITSDYPLDSEPYIYIADLYCPADGDTITVYSIVFTDAGYFVNSSYVSVAKQGWNKVLLKGTFGTNRPEGVSLVSWDIRTETDVSGSKIKNARLLYGADVQVYETLKADLNEVESAQSDTIPNILYPSRLNQFSHTDDGTDALFLHKHTNGSVTQSTGEVVTADFFKTAIKVDVPQLNRVNVYTRKIDIHDTLTTDTKITYGFWYKDSNLTSINPALVTDIGTTSNFAGLKTKVVNGWTCIYLQGWSNAAIAGATWMRMYIPVNATSAAEDFSIKIAAPFIAIGEKLPPTPSFYDNVMLSEIEGSKTIECVGDSLTAASYPANLQTLLGEKYIVNNSGIGGESVRTIFSRTGAIPMYIDGEITIPADTSVVNLGTRAAAPLKSMLGDYACYPVRPNYANPDGVILYNPVTVGGIECTLGWTGSTDTDPLGEFTIQRNTAGTARTFQNPNIHTNNQKHMGVADVQIIFAETNGGYQNDADLIAQIEKQSAFCAPSKFIVISSHLSNSTKEALYLAAFGNRYINLRVYMYKYGLEDAGITPTQADLDAIAAGQCPPSLLVDGIHFTSAGYQLLAQQVYQKIIELGY